jgi:DNA-binding MarR family transcriptional regulator
MQLNLAGARAALDASKLGKVLGFMRVLLAVDHAVQACSKRMHIRFGVTASQRLLLRTVGMYPGISAGDVAAIMEVDPSTITPILFRLEQEKAILREVDAVDRRRALLKLTPKGKKVDSLRSGTVETALKKALSRVSDADRATTERVLRVVTEELDRIS